MNVLLASAQKEVEEHGASFVLVTKLKHLQDLMQEKEKILDDILKSLQRVESTLNKAKESFKIGIKLWKT